MGNKRIIYSKEEHAWLHDNYMLVISDYTSRFNQRFGRNLKKSNLSAYRKRHGLKTGRTGYFESGSAPWNTGLKGVNGDSSTRFRKGMAPVNARPLGSTRFDRDGYESIKVNEGGRWQLVHKFLWEHLVGEIPDGHILIFKDGNQRNNADLENLTLVTRHEHMQINKLGGNKLNAELKPTVIALGKLVAKQNELSRAG